MWDLLPGEKWMKKGKFVLSWQLLKLGLGSCPHHRTIL